MSLVHKAERFAFLHYSQSDQLDVYHHSESVVVKLADYGVLHQTVGWLHDIVEDTGVNIPQVREQFGSRVADAVDAMTRRDGEVYFEDYLPRVKANPIAWVVKSKDAEHNFERPRVYGWTDEHYQSLQKKYMRVLEELEY